MSLSIEDRVKLQIGALIVQALALQAESEELREAISQQNAEIAKLHREQSLREQANG